MQASNQRHEPTGPSSELNFSKLLPLFDNWLQLETSSMLFASCLTHWGDGWRMQIPLWQLAGAFSSAVLPPHMHRTGDQLDYVAAATPGSLVATSTGNDRHLSPGAVAGIVLVSFGVLCMAAAAAALLVVRWRAGHHGNHKVI
jgi:hypothetical protein